MEIMHQKGLFRDFSVCCLVFTLALLLVLSQVRAYRIWAAPEALRAASGQDNPASNSHNVERINLSLWRVDGGFTSTISIKNNLVTGPITVFPVLYMLDGSPYPLPPVSLQPEGITTIDVNKCLASAPAAVIPHLSEMGSAVLLYSFPGRGAVAAEMRVLNAPASLIFSYGGVASVQGVAVDQTLEGLWWKHDPNVGGFVAFTNTTDRQENLSYEFLGAEGAALPEQLLSLGAHATQVVDLDSALRGLPSDGNNAGGIRVKYNGSASDLIVSGGLENVREGFSAIVPFWPKPADAHAEAQLGYASTGMLIGRPSGQAGFPDGTSFTPYAFVRNTTSRPVEVTPAIHVMQQGQANSMPLPVERLAPGETKELPLKHLLGTTGLGTFDGTITLSLNFTGRPGDVVLATGSVDQTGTYVFEVLPQQIGQSWEKDVPFWSLADGYDSMFSVWNLGTAPEKILFTLTYADRKGHYKLALDLQPGASQVIDIAQLIAAQQPDLEGNVIPRDVRQGSAGFSGMSGMTELIQLVIGALMFNVQTATCGLCCTCCSGVSNLSISPNPMTCPYKTSVQAKATAKYLNGTTKDVTNYVTWKSSNTSVVTVNSTGLVTSVGVGKATITADLYAADTLVACGGGCPFGTFCATCPVCSVPTVTVSCTPQDLAFGQTAPSNTTSGSCSATVNPSGGTYSWSVNTNTVTLSSTTAASPSYNSANPSSSQGDTTISVTYSFNGESATAQSSAITVQKPTSLSLVTTTFNGAASCQSGYAGWERDVTWQVLDQFGLSMQFAGLPASDQISIGSPNSCGASNPKTGTGYTTSTGSFPDKYSVCSTACRTGNCQTNAAQTWTVAGVQLSQSISIVYTCSSITLNGM